MEKHRPRVVLADDHAELLVRFRRLLEPQFDVVGTAGDGLSVLVVAEDLSPDVWVLDTSMPGINGIEAARRLRQRDPAAKIVILTMHQDPALVEQALSRRGFRLCPQNRGPVRTCDCSQ